MKIIGISDNSCCDGKYLVEVSGGEIARIVGHDYTICEGFKSQFPQGIRVGMVVQVDAIWDRLGKWRNARDRTNALSKELQVLADQVRFPESLASVIEPSK